MKIMHKSAVIIADGSFPKHEIPLSILKNAPFLIACDGAVAQLEKRNIRADIIVGDLDSIPPKLKMKYQKIIAYSTDQDTNDLTKAVNWAHEHSFTSVQIVGATGKREDHTLGNISLLYSYSKLLYVELITNKGRFIPVNKSTTINCQKGCQVSLFANNTDTEITSKNLKYPLNKMKLTELWMGTLNEATEDHFTLDFEEGQLLVFLPF